MIWSQLPQFFVSGLTSGSIYALIALGFGIIHNATGIVNFAQGEFVMLGAMTMISLTQVAGLPLLIAFPLAVLAVMAVGWLMEVGPIRRARSDSILILVMITVGASITMRETAMHIWGKTPRTLPPFSGDEPLILGSAAILPQTLWILGITLLVVVLLGFFFSRTMVGKAMRETAMHIWGKTPRTLPPFSGDEPLILGSAAILPQTLWILGITLVVVVLLGFFFSRTMVGKAMRAVAENRRGAALIGIDVYRMTLLSFVLSGGIGAVAGIIITPITTMSYSAGVMLALKGFAAAILGGYGSMKGAVLGGLLLGAMETFGAGFVSSAYKDAFAFLILLLVLFIRPTGLFGKEEVKRV